MEKEELYKIRSSSGCVSAAWKWSCNHAGTIFRRTWLPVTLFAVFAAAYRILCFEQSQTIFNNIWFTIGLTFAVVGMFVSCNWSLSRLFQYLTGQPRQPIYRRCFLALLLTCVLFGLITVAIYGISLIKDGPWWVLLLSALLLLLITLPIHYHHIRYVFEGGHYFKSSIHGLRRGYRYLGRIIATTLLTLFLLLMITVLLAIPQFTVNIADIASQDSTTIGDPNGMPNSFVWLLGAITFLSVWGIYYLWQFLSVVNTYLYGSIEQHYQERQSTLNTIENG